MISEVAATSVNIDWTLIILAIIAGVPTWAALAGRRASIEGKQESVAASNEAKTESVAASLSAKKTAQDTHDAVNHRMDAFLADLAKSNAEVLKTAIAEARAEGIKQTEDTIKAVALTVKNDTPKAAQVVNTPETPVPTKSNP